MKEAEANIRSRFRNRKGAEAFVTSERTKVFNRLMGIESFEGVYRSVSSPTDVSKSKSNSLFGG